MASDLFPKAPSASELFFSVPFEKKNFERLPAFIHRGQQVPPRPRIATLILDDRLRNARAWPLLLTLWINALSVARSYPQGSTGCSGRYVTHGGHFSPSATYVPLWITSPALSFVLLESTSR